MAFWQIHGLMKKETQDLSPEMLRLCLCIAVNQGSIDRLGSSGSV